MVMPQTRKVLFNFKAYFASEYGMALYLVLQLRR